MIHKTKYNIFPIVFVVLLTIPSIFMLLNIQDIPSSENRALAQKPALNINHLDPFPIQYEKYYNDHFPQRNRLLKWFGYYKSFALYTSPINNAIFGKNNWLFMANEYTDFYTGTNLFSKKELNLFKQELLRRQKFIEKHNGKYYFVIIPIKSTIYPEFMPDILVQNNNNRTKQLINFLNKNTNIKVLYLKECLQKAKLKYNKPIYKKYDNHWTDYGGFEASKAIVNFINKTGKLSLDKTVFDINNYTAVDTGKISGNIADMMGISDIFTEPDYRLFHKKHIVHNDIKKNYPPDKGFPYKWNYEIVKTTNDSLKPNLLVIRDSFGEKTIPYLSASFNHSCYIFDSWKHQLNPDIIKQEQPDIYINLVLEAFLQNMINNDSCMKEK